MQAGALPEARHLSTPARRPAPRARLPPCPLPVGSRLAAQAGRSLRPDAGSPRLGSQARRPRVSAWRLRPVGRAGCRQPRWRPLSGAQVRCLRPLPGSPAVSARRPLPGGLGPLHRPDGLRPRCPCLAPDGYRPRAGCPTGPACTGPSPPVRCRAALVPGAPRPLPWRLAALARRPGPMAGARCSIPAGCCPLSRAHARFRGAGACRHRSLAIRRWPYGGTEPPSKGSP